MAINENNYRTLKPDERTHFVPFSLEAVSDNQVNHIEQLQIHEISTKYFHQAFTQSEFTWVHLWQAFCKNDYCQNISAFQKQEQDLARHGLNLMLVSNTYDFEDIQNCAQNSGFTRPIYVLDNAHYGHKVRPGILKALSELGVDVSDKQAILVDDLLFKGNDLVHYGRKLSTQAMDSVLVAEGL